MHEFSKMHFGTAATKDIRICLNKKLRTLLKLDKKFLYFYLQIFAS